MIISGIHHITAIASNPQGNLDYYTKTLGLRLVKLTVNFDDPGTYHFYFGDYHGNPGTILTFFPWPGAAKGLQGNSQATAVPFATASLVGWREKVNGGEPFQRFDTWVMPFMDPDGMALELVAPILEGEHSPITGFAGVTLSVSSISATAKLLTEVFGYREMQNEPNRSRYVSTAGNYVDLVTDSRRGTMGSGTVHHVAFRTEDDATQLRWLTELSKLGYPVTPVQDRQYFHSIYFREPGGILFEIATDPPGFATDETLENLGTHLKLPSWLEKSRAQAEARLPKLELPR